MIININIYGTSLVAHLVKNFYAMQETQVRSLGGEDPLEKKMTTHTSILPWENPMGQKSLVSYSPWGHKNWTQRLSHQHFYVICLCSLVFVPFSSFPAFFWSNLIIFIMNFTFTEVFWFYLSDCCMGDMTQELKVWLKEQI